LLTPTFADALKEQLGDESRVVCLSLKDRSSVLPGGKRPDACYWFDKYGRVSTSTYYRDYPHDWVKEFNRAALVDQWHDKQWHRLRDDLNYTKYSGADDVKGESKGYAQGITFPHRFWDGPKKKRQNYYEAVECSPAGNELLLTLAKKAIEAEKLGQRDQPDFLSISFSSNDLVGHAWGPDSQEVLDITLRTDLLVKELLTFLDAKVGKGKYALAMTADHGICPLPEVSRSKGFPARRVDHDKLMRQAEEFLDHSFPPDNLDTYGKGKWIESHNLMLYLNHKRMKLRGVNSLQVETALSNWMLERNGIEVATTRSAILLEQVKGDIGERIVKSFVADRSGDVMLVPKMYCLITTSTTGTTHGSPYPYDTHVPLMILGPGIKAGLHKERVSPGLMPVLLARATQIQPPKQAEAKIPPGVFD
jgi:predicted AlkP superfamily pyrophosphatase or phosphodiesterase